MHGSAEIQRAVEILRSGGLVAFATETVYGLGADATNAQAVGKIFSVKGRPGGNPLIVHVADAAVARRYVADWPESAERLARAIWPGPLTLVLPKGEQIVPVVTAGLATVAIRCPDHPIALELLRQFAGPIAAPSANRSNRISPTTADHVRRELGGRVDLILDGGPCRVGIESTVVDLTSPQPAILRPGAVSQQRLQELLGPVEIRMAAGDDRKPIRSPGQQEVHYSPSTPAFRLGDADMKLLSASFSGPPGGNAIFLMIRGTELALRLRKWCKPEAIIEMPSSAEEYARRLYAALREADDRHADAIWVQLPPDESEWDAVRDRVFRATRPASEAR
ncbi:MAG: L-threonylcarbamoyladenylate synthase [Tepidisphaeraceae bacterium]|jgi:L-threonylcarbamoyladenylate synthase